MNYIIDFYKELDTINLILFWGIIIVIVLLLTFSIIIVNKNRKLKQLLLLKEHESTNDSNDVPLIIENNNYENNYHIKNEHKEEMNKEETNNIDTTSYYKEPEKTIAVEKEIPTIEEVKEIKPVERKEFIAEEHVMEYHKDDRTNFNNIRVNTEKYAPPTSEETNKPYQKNILREISSNQTSPIGIVKKNNETERHILHAEDLNHALQNNHAEKYSQSKEQTNNTSSNYLREVSAKLNAVNNQDDIDRTAYELKQEEDAIISYQELLKKKDSLEIIDEEDAVISLDELISRKKQREKLYNITEEEENNEFISELKHFRHDL